MKEKIYISGPMKGRPDSDVYHEFFNKEIELSEKGFEVVVPLNNGISHLASYNEHLVKDIEMLLTCDAVYMLPNWHLSQGARVEHFIANTYGKKVYYE